MRVNLLRKIDKHLGPVVCKIILLLKQTFLKFSSRNQLEISKDLRKVLIIKFFGMGTILLSSPAILELKKKFPNLEVSFLTLAQNKEVCETLTSVDTVFLLRIDSLYNFVEDFVDVLVFFQRYLILGVLISVILGPLAKIALKKGDLEISTVYIYEEQRRGPDHRSPLFRPE